MEGEKSDIGVSALSSRVRRVGLVFLCLMLWACGSSSGGEEETCQPEDYPCPCLETQNPKVIFGDFSLGIEDWPNGSGIPVWHPPQGGIVTGFNLVVTGTPKRASRILTTLEDADDGTLLVEDSIRKVKLLCQESGVRLLPQFMVAFEWQFKLEDLVERNAIITIELIFNEDEPEQYSIIGTHEGVLLDEEP